MHIKTMACQNTNIKQQHRSNEVKAKSHEQCLHKKVVRSANNDFVNEVSIESQE